MLKNIASYPVDFDTGSSDLFLPGPACDNTCAGHAIYNPKSSSTSKDLGKTFSISYGDGSSVSGEQYQDTVSIAGLQAQGQTLGVASEYSLGFEKNAYPPDGLMGMAFQSISEYDASPVFQTLVSQGYKSPSFSFKLSSTTGSELYLGGANPSLYKGSFTYVPVAKADQGYWKVDMDGVKVGSQTPVGMTKAIIDTGTTLIIGDMDGVQQVYNAIPGSAADSSLGAGFYTVPCNAIPTIQFQFGGQLFSISPETFNLGPVSPGSSQCTGALIGKDLASSQYSTMFL